MTDLTVKIGFFVLILAWVGVTLAIVLYRGCLSPAAFRLAPRRRVGIRGFDILIGIGLALYGTVMLGMLLSAIGATPGEDEAAADLGPMTYAVRILASQLLIQGLIALYLVMRASRVRRGVYRLGILPRRFGRELRMTFLGLLAAVPLAMGANMLTVTIGNLLGIPAPQIGHDVLAWLTSPQPWPALVMVVLSAVVIAPILEEMTYRGLLQTALLHMLGEDRRWPAILITAACFALVHSRVAAWQAMPGLFVLGVVFGYLYEKSGSLLPPILVHLCFNALNIIMVMTITNPQ